MFLEQPRSILEHSTAVTALAFSADSLLLAVGGGYPGDARPYEVRLWDAPAGTPSRCSVPLLFPSEVNALAFSPDGRMLAVGEDNGSVTLWSPHTGELLLRMDDPLSPDPENRHPQGQPPLARGKVESVAFSPDGRFLASAGSGGILFWDIRTGRLRGRIENQTERHNFEQVLFLPETAEPTEPEERAGQEHGSPLRQRQTMATLDARRLQLWDVFFETEASAAAAGEPVGTSNMNDTAATVSVAHRKALVEAEVTQDGRLGEFLYKVAFSPRGDRIAVVHAPAVPDICDCVSLYACSADWQPGARVWSDGQFMGAVGDICFSPDGTLLAMACQDWNTAKTELEVQIRDASTGKLRQALPCLMRRGDETLCVCFSPDGRMLATSAPDNQMHLFHEQGR